MCVAHMCHSRSVSAHLGRFHSLRCPSKGRDAPRDLQQAYRDEARDLANLRGWCVCVDDMCHMLCCACVHGHGESSGFTSNDELALMESDDFTLRT